MDGPLNSVFCPAGALEITLITVCGCPDLQVVLWDHDRATAGDVCTCVLTVTVRVISLPQVLVGGTLSEMTGTTSFDVNELCDVVTEQTHSFSSDHH